MDLSGVPRIGDFLGARAIRGAILVFQLAPQA